MSNEKKTANRPTHAIYVVQGEDDNARWHKIGAAWLHKDKKGANLAFDSFPLAGRIVIREVSEKDEAQSEAATNNGGQQ